MDHLKRVMISDSELDQEIQSSMVHRLRTDDVHDGRYIHERFSKCCRLTNRMQTQPKIINFAF